MSFKKIGFVETLIETINRSWGLKPIVLPPPPLGHPPIAITPDKVEKYPEKRGGQGDAPLGLPPPLGESGGHSLIISQKLAIKGFLAL